MYYSDFIYIQGNKKPKAIINSILSKLNHWHVVHVIERYLTLNTKVTNAKDFIRSMIYNTVLELGTNYSNQAKS
jgi:hypothetical protein